MNRNAGLITLLAVVLVWNAAHAQILNTLRGWSDIDEGWSVEVEGKFSLTRGNYHHMDLSSNGAVQFLTGRNRFRFMISDKFYIIDGTTVSEDFTVHLRHNYRLTDVFVTLLFAQNQYKPYKYLQRRSLLGGGIRADIVRESACDAAVGISAMVESIALTEDAQEEDHTNARGSFFVSFVWKPVNRFTVDLSGFYQPLLPEFNEPLIMSTLSLEADLLDGLSMITSLDITYDHSPAEGIERTDLGLKSGLRFRL